MKSYIIAGAVLLLCLVPVHGASHASLLSPDGYRRAQAQWQARFLSTDIETAYADLVREGNTMTPDESHLLAHIVGGILFDLKGLDGLSYCSDDFDFGCYHGVVARLLEEEGLQGLPRLQQACEKIDPVNCRHGFGHAMLVYYGNDDIDDALRSCGQSSRRDDPCLNGVFMEYFLNSARKSEMTGVLAVDPKWPAAPCETLEARFKPACYYEIPVLWRVQSKRAETDYAAQMRSVGTQCAAVTDTVLRQSCYSGMGVTIALFLRKTPDVAKGVCESLPAEGKNACLNEAAQVLRMYGISWSATTTKAI